MQNLVVEKEMKIAVERLSWKELFDKTEQNRKIGYDVMYCEDIEILKNDYKRYTMVIGLLMISHHFILWVILKDIQFQLAMKICMI
mgnify:CR=1 FL=1